MTTDLLDPANAMPASEGDSALLASVRAALAGPSGRLLLAHLERRYLQHALPPQASDAELRHLEGQRSVVLYLNHLVATACRGAPGDRA